MQVYKSPIVGNLPAVILVSHGMLAQGLFNSASLIFGEDIENIAYLCLEPGDSPDDFKTELSKFLEEYRTQIIVLADLFGGTPSNCFISAINTAKNKCNAVTGMNLPMLLEILSNRAGKTTGELSDIAESSGKESIVNVTQQLMGIKY